MILVRSQNFESLRTYGDVCEKYNIGNLSSISPLINRLVSINNYTLNYIINVKCYKGF